MWVLCFFFSCSHQEDRWAEEQYERDKRQAEWDFSKDNFFCDVPGTLAYMCGNRFYLDVPGTLAYMCGYRFYLDVPGTLAYMCGYILYLGVPGTLAYMCGYRLYLDVPGTLGVSWLLVHITCVELLMSVSTGDRYSRMVFASAEGQNLWSTQAIKSMCNLDNIKVCEELK